MIAFKGRPRFFWAALVVGTLVMAAWGFETVNLFRLGRYQKVHGWTAVPTAGAWAVGNVDATGPAAGKLARGDRLLAIDGDTRVARTGPLWRITDTPPDRRYEVVIERQGQRLTIPLSFVVRAEPNNLAWGLLFLFVALAFMVTGLMLGLLKPEDATARDGFAVSMLLALFMLVPASNLLNGMLRGFPLWVALAMYSVVPMHLLYAYLFFAGFPQRQPEEGGWRVLRTALVALALAIWLPGTLVHVVHALGPDQASAIVDRFWSAYALYRVVVAPAQLLFLAVTAVATLAVGLRNYRRLGEGDLRRRLRWVAWGALGGTLPTVGASLFWGLLRAAGVEEQWSDFISALTRVTNAMVLVIPVTMAYAILKHRVLGIQVVLRMGLQYLLASHSLRVILFLPVGGLVYVFATNPDKTLGELLLRRSATFNLALLALAALSLRSRARLTTAIDRRFFREAYQREQILVRLADQIKDLDTVAEVSHRLSTEVESALHSRWVSVLYHAEQRPEFSLIYSTAMREAELDLPDSAVIVKRLEQHGRAESWDALRARLPVEEAVWLASLDVRLLVPILGTDRRLIGILMLGEKLSEEPYTRKDEELLESIAAQIGVLCENFSLRERVRKGKQAQEEVLARLESRQVNVVKECPLCRACYDSTALRCEKDGTELELTLPVERIVDGKYRLDRLVGRGGMGAVYEARDLRLDRRVAVKVMTGALFGDAAAFRRFSREARASARLEHPNIVRVHDFGELAGNGGYLVMEYVVGVTWRAHLRKLGVFPPLTAADLLDQLLAGIEAAHQAQIIHRDLKPDNLLLAGETVKILDFGLAKVRESGFADPKSLTAAGAVMGTPGYMAPEQLMGEEVDERADIYALGVIALETLTGELALRGRWRHEQIAGALAERFAFEGAGTEHASVAAVLAAALAARREERTASATELRGALIAALRSCPPFPQHPHHATASATEDTRTIAD